VMSSGNCFEYAVGRKSVLPTVPPPRPLPSLPTPLSTRLIGPVQCDRVEQQLSFNSDCSTAAPSEVDGEDTVHNISPNFASRFKLRNKKITKFRPPPGLEAPAGVPGSIFQGMGNYRPGQVFQREASLVQPMACTQQDNSVVLNLADSVDEPCGLGVHGFPSAGSVGHHLGLCKPCDFVHRGSCRLGAECQYCHLCDREEGQQRKKDKKWFLKAVKNLHPSTRSSQRCGCE